MVSSSSSGLGDVRQPVRLSVPESSGGRRLGTSARDGGTFKAAAAGRRSYNEKRRLKSLEKYRSPTAPTSTELGQLIAQGPQVWHKVLCACAECVRPSRTGPCAEPFRCAAGDALTIPQVVEYLADPLLHGAPVPPIVGAEITPWYEFVRRLNKHLKPGNPTLELPADVRSTLLHNGVTRILQHQPSTDPFLLLLLLDLCLATDAQSSVELFRTIAGRVHDARASWWIGDEPQPKHLAEVQRPQETFTLVDRNRLALTREGIVDAWDQSVLLSPPLLHRRRLFNRLSGHNSKDRLASTPEGQRAIGGVDYTMNFVTSSAVQQPTDPIVLILILKSYLSTYPSESGQAHFRATLDIVPQLALSWTPVYKHSIRESIKTCIQADTEMYHAVRSWFRNELRPYLGDMTALWHGILPSPREVGFGLVSHEARSEARSLAYKHGKNLYDPGEALDFNRLRPRNPDAIPLWREGEAAPPKRISRYEVDGSFGLRQ